MRTFIPATLLFLLFLGTSGTLPVHADGAEATHTGKPIAEIDGQPLTWSELESFAASQLREVDTKRQQILEASLTSLIEQRLLEREADRREVSVAELLHSEIEEHVEPVTDAQIDAWYEQNKARVRQPKEAVSEQVRSFLWQQRADPIRRQLIAGLRQDYGVKMLFEPPRAEIDATGSPAKGPENAAVTVVEFSDFQCPACKSLQGDFKRLKETYSDRVRFAFRQFPLTSIHPQAFKAAEAALCAEDQGKFWNMHDALFEHQRELGIDQLKTRATELELDADTFTKCLDSGVHADQVRTDMRAGQEAGVTGTPSIFVNGRRVTLLRGVSPFEVISAIIDDELERAGSS